MAGRPLSKTPKMIFRLVAPADKVLNQKARAVADHDAQGNMAEAIRQLIERRYFEITKIVSDPETSPR